ncbi:hypothetical protein AG4045_026287 [Apium graveolens]|uniref:Uncharacterized protein n=1 Tax=Apium graveolens TaxID=4045 RepID=A0A6L5BBC5_APIGR|nr:hypothetical protein AG4045_026287 [Apium graveolens]
MVLMVITSGNRSSASKRASSDDDDSTRPHKVKKMKCLDLILVEKVYKFRVLLPNSDCVMMRVIDPPNNQMPVVVFTDLVKEEYERVGFENRIKDVICFEIYETDKVYTLRLNDGSNGDEFYENMWDLTPDVELLSELPQEYAFESALDDLIVKLLDLAAIRGRGVPHFTDHIEDEQLVASLRNRSHTIVSSKTKNSKKVYTLHLRRDALLSSSGSDKT